MAHYPYQNYILFRVLSHRETIGIGGKSKNASTISFSRQTLMLAALAKMCFLGMLLPFSTYTSHIKLEVGSFMALYEGLYFTYMD